METDNLIWEVGCVHFTSPGGKSPNLPVALFALQWIEPKKSSGMRSFSLLPFETQLDNWLILGPPEGFLPPGVA